MFGVQHEPPDATEANWKNTTAAALVCNFFGERDKVIRGKNSGDLDSKLFLEVKY